MQSTPPFAFVELELQPSIESLRPVLGLTVVLVHSVAVAAAKVFDQPADCVTPGIAKSINLEKSANINVDNSG